jgi:integrase
MTGKRQFGSIRRLPSGRWQARYRTPDGQLATAPKTFKTKGDASRWLAGVEADQARGVWLDPSAGRVRLAEYADAWLRGKTNISPRTREIYALQLRLHVLPEIVDDVPALGLVPLGQLTSELVRAWYAALASRRSKSVAAKAYVRLRQILTQAVNDDRIAKNPCRIEGAGAERHPEQRFISLPELYAVAAEVPDRYRALVLTAGYAGLRQGELFALRRSDIDLLHGTVTIRRKRLRLASGEVIEDDPKSEAGRRKVALPQPLIEELHRHLSTYGSPIPGSYVFTSRDGEPIERSNFRRRVWLPATARAGLAGLRFHDLRHAAGTLAAQTGATTKELMARLGHASARAAMIYQHATEERDRLIADRLGQMAAEAGVAPVVPIERARTATAGESAEHA